MTSYPWKRRKYYIHGIQKKYALLTLGILTVYTFILSVNLFIPPSLKLKADVPLEEQIEAAAQFIALSDLLWPAVLISIPTFMVLSIFVTHRLAGPIYRIEQSLKQMAAGDLNFHVRFRSGDDLQELGDLINQTIQRQRDLLQTVKSVHHKLDETLKKAGDRTEDSDRSKLYLREMETEIKRLDALLRQYKADSSGEPSNR